MNTNQVETSQGTQKFCRCGNPYRPGQRNCKECHRFLQQNYRSQARSELLKSRELFYACVRNHSDETRRRFEEHIHTPHVAVATDPCKLAYIGLAIGFLPSDIVIILKDDGRLVKVELKDIFNYGETSNQPN
jgi:hypothetical protein